MISKRQCRHLILGKSCSSLHFSHYNSLLRNLHMASKFRVCSYGASSAV